MTIKMPPIESDLFPSWEKHIENNPELKNSPDIVRKNYEERVDELYTSLILLSTY